MAAIVANTGSNNWNTNGAWVGGVQPSAADDVTIPATAVVTIPTATTVQARSVTISLSGTVAFASTTAVINIGDATTGAGNVAFSNAGTITLTGIGVMNFISTSTTVQTITTGGQTLPTWTINGVGSKYQLADANTVGSTTTITLTAGTLDTNGQTCSWGSFSSSNANVRTLTMGASAITLTGTGSPWTTTTITNLTVTANTATVTMTGAGAAFTSGSINFNGLSVVSTGSGLTSFLGSTVYTLANVTRTGTAVKTDSMRFQMPLTITGTLTITGNSVTNRMLVFAATAGTTRTLTAAVVSLTNVDFTDIVGAGAAAPFTGTSLGDALGNTNITTDTPVTQTWQGTLGGNWSDVTKWTSRVPLPQDSVVVNAAFSASQVVTLDMPRLGKDIDFTGVSGSVRIVNGVSQTSYGSLTLAAGILAATSFQNGFNMTLSGRGTHTITSAGISFGGSAGFTVDGIGGTYTLQDAFLNAVTRSLTITPGTTFTANSFNVSAAAVNVAAGAVTTTINMGSGTWSLTSTSTIAIWNVTGAGAVINPSTSTIAITTASTNVRTFTGNGLVYNNFTYTVAGSTGGLDVTGANTFNSFSFSDASNARTLRFTAATTNTFTTFNVNGTAAKLMTISSITAATHTLSKASGVVSDDYLSITNSIATGGASWYAGANSIDGGGNTGWFFFAPSSGSSPNLLLMGMG